MLDPGIALHIGTIVEIVPMWSAHKKSMQQGLKLNFFKKTAVFLTFCLAMSTARHPLESACHGVEQPFLVQGTSKHTRGSKSPYGQGLFANFANSISMLYNYID
jgi:hypothetical protein